MYKEKKTKANETHTRIHSSAGRAHNWSRRALASTALSRQNFKHNLVHGLVIQFQQILLFRCSKSIPSQHVLNKGNRVYPGMGAFHGNTARAISPCGKPGQLPSPASRPPAFLWIQAPPESHDGLNAQLTAY